MNLCVEKGNRESGPLKRDSTLTFSLYLDDYARETPPPLLRHIWSLRSASEQQGEGQPLRSLRPQSPSAIGQRAPASLFQSHGCVRHSLSERMREMHAELRVYRYGRDLLLKPRELTAHA
ncbi:hypothetical protein QQF64_017842 [Cirrhinus molitorella]|uniref:Uncharacterized protein n=1 Tax=Cirrhinus molitorella TaxID=172907 RepID=A0ABR3LN21_9TELE